ncbi:hypothetical protein SO802_023518 [Lithocarpus litseifolius]|uniref:Uncharacterized protein n=1 Tax=Lithocarpus litseifolius TaxID=425828 RepID=A0AAW2C6F6_9ROSI
MATSSKDLMAQKILKALDEHGEALKKIGGRLTRLEESRLKKSTHVEIRDNEEEVEEWDEKDKAENERNKQFEKLTVETVAMREKMEKMQLAFRKAQGMDDYLYNMGGEKLTMLIKEVLEEVDWMKYMDAEAMKTMMKTNGDVFTITNEESSDPSKFIMPTIGPINNWTWLGFLRT